MIRHIAKQGERLWFSDHFTELQSEPLQAIDKLASYYGPCALAGGQVYDVVPSEDKNRFTEAIVVLFVPDENQYMVMPLKDEGYEYGLGKTRYVVVEKTDILGRYKMGEDVIAYRYRAIIQESTPITGANRENTYITIPANASHIPDVLDKLEAKLILRNAFALYSHTHDIADEVMDIFARKIEKLQLPASKITSGTFDTERIPTLEIDKINGLAEALNNRATRDVLRDQVIVEVVERIDDRIEALRPDGANLELQIIDKIEQLRPEADYKNASVEQLKTALKQAGLVDSADVNTAINAKIPEVETLLSGVDAEITALNTALSQANAKINTLETFKDTIDYSQIITTVRRLEDNVTNLESNIAVNQNFRDNIKAAILSDRNFFIDALTDPKL